VALVAGLAASDPLPWKYSVTGFITSDQFR